MYMYIYIHTYAYICMYVYVYIYIYMAMGMLRTRGCVGARARMRAQRCRPAAIHCTSCCLSNSFRMCLNCEVIRGMFPWRTRYPLSRCRANHCTC